MRWTQIHPVLAGAWALFAAAGVSAGEGPVAHWDFNEGRGSVLHDRSGNENHGTIHGARWVPSGVGSALRFDGEDDYVDCGNGPGLDITGPITLMAWIQPTEANRGEPGIVGKFFESYAITYYGEAFWYISSGGNNLSVPTHIGSWVHVAGTFDGTTMWIYLNGVERRTKPSKFPSVEHGKNFLMGCVVGDPENMDVNLQKTAFFPGLIDDVRVYDRALSESEIIRCYNEEAAGKGNEPFDENRLGRFTLEPFFYPDRERAVLSVNFHWVRELLEGATMAAELARPGDQPLQIRALDSEDARHEAEAEFSLAGLEPGAYELRAVLRAGDETVTRAAVPFEYPLPPQPPVVAPAVARTPPLPAPVTPPAYGVELRAGGGFVVTVAGHAFPVESSYSYPHGGDNRLSAGAADTQGEAEWRVSTNRAAAGLYGVTAAGRFYEITRRIALEPSRIVVRDTIRNRGEEVVGIIVDNHLNTRALKDAKVTNMTNPTIFVGAGQVGVGLIALDDLYQLQQESSSTDGRAGVRTAHFGLDVSASYTLEWAVYPTASADYYDFINQVRRDEGISGRVDGAMAFVGRRDPPSPDFVDLRNLAYFSIGCLGKPADDPTVSLEGWEFMEYPKEVALIKDTWARTKALFPRAAVMFHVAHSLYATGTPEQLWPDSRAIDTNGRQFHYGPDTLEYHGRYFSKDRFDEGWRWWIYYPTESNSFGKAMIEATEFMMKDMDADGMWADGFISGYVKGGYSYDRWDGHSVTIDPETKLVTRKKTCVPYVALPVLKQVVRIIRDNGGVVLTNGHPGPRSLWREHMITCSETGGGDARPVGGLHLGRTLCPLGNPYTIKNGRDVYRDILSKLELGALYFWYGNHQALRHNTLVEHMYPITFESIHRGTVRGMERIVTKISGVYGWPGDRALHQVFLYDARGALTRSRFLTTVDASSVRTELRLGEDQSAAVVRVPLARESASPVNVNVEDWSPQTVRLALHGTGSIRVYGLTDGFEEASAAGGWVAADADGNELGRCGDVLDISVQLKGAHAIVLRAIDG